MQCERENLKPVKPRSLSRFALLGLILATLGVRTGASLQWNGDHVSLRASLTQDTDSYLRLGSNWARTGVYGFEDESGNVSPSAFRPPLLPWILSWFAAAPTDNSQQTAGQASTLWHVPAIYIAVINLALGVLTSAITAIIAMQIVGRQRAAIVAGLLITMDPILLRAGQSAMTETLATFLAALCWLLWMKTWQADSKTSGWLRWSWTLLLGTTFGLSILARPTAAPVITMCMIAHVLAGVGCWKQRLGRVAVASCVTAAVVSPWILRNMVQLGKPIWATTHGGYTLLLANNPQLYDHMSQAGPSRDWDASNFHNAWIARDLDSLTFNPLAVEQRLGSTQEALPELEDDRFAYEAARENIRSSPVMFAISGVYRVLWLWAPWPNQGSLLARTLVGAWYITLYGAALLGLWRSWQNQKTATTDGHRGPSMPHSLRLQAAQWIVPFAICICLSGIHAVYWSNMRMRAPALPGVCVAAVLLIGANSSRRREISRT